MEPGGKGKEETKHLELHAVLVRTKTVHRAQGMFNFENQKGSQQCHILKTNRSSRVKHRSHRFSGCLDRYRKPEAVEHYWFNTANLHSEKKLSNFFSKKLYFFLKL